MAKKKNKNRQKSVETNQLNNNNRFADALRQNIEQKNKIAERKDVTEKDIKQMEIQEEEKKEQHLKDKKVNTPKEVYKVDENFKRKVLNWKDVLVRMGLGALIGVSAVVPTNSTVTLLALTKKYDDVIYSFKDIFKPRNVRQWGLSLLWILPLIVTWFGLFILTYYIIYKISYVGFGPAMMIGFSGFTFFSIPIFFLIVKPPFLKNIYDFKKENMDNRPRIAIVVFVIAVMLMIMLGLISRFAWQSNNNSAIVAGMSLQSFDPSIVSSSTNSGLISYKEFHNTNAYNQTQIALLNLVASFFAGLVVLIPGISSGIMLTTFGRWTQMNYGVQVGFGANYSDIQNFLIHNDYSVQWAWPIIIVSAFGAILGFIASIFLITWIKSKWNDQYNIFCVGLMFGGLIGNYIAISPMDYYILGHDPKVLGCALGLFFGMSIPAGAWFVYLNERNYINIEKLKFSKYYKKHEIGHEVR